MNRLHHADPALSLVVHFTFPRNLQAQGRQAHTRDAVGGFPPNSMISRDWMATCQGCYSHYTEQEIGLDYL